MERDKIIQGVVIAILLSFAFWSGGNYQLARLYNMSAGAYPLINAGP
jgi:hypothetical protein